jgi:hypothetical protein
MRAFRVFEIKDLSKGGLCSCFWGLGFNSNKGGVFQLLEALGF